MERLVKGIHVIPLHDFIKENYDDETRNGIYERMSEPAREMLRTIKREDWMPVEHVGNVASALFHASGEREHGYQDMVRAGAAIADYATNTYVRLLIKLMTPKIMASKWPDIWKKSHNFGLMQCQLENDRMLRMTLSGVENYTHIGPVAVGFLTFALKAMNMPDATVLQVGDRFANVNAERYEFSINW
jgi:hypothetical protein